MQRHCTAWISTSKANSLAIAVQRHINRPSTHTLCCSITYKKFNLQLVCLHMEIMEGVHLHFLLLLVTLIQGIQGQAAVTPSSVALAVGDDVSLICITTTTRDPFTFTWTHVSSTGTVPVYTGGIKQTANDEYVNFDIDEDITGKRSTLIIESIIRQDGGEYQCTATGQSSIPPATVTVEEGSTSQSIGLKSTGDDSSYTYQATCEAIGTSPEETITWILGGVTEPVGDRIVETDPGTSDDSLFDKRSIFTFPATTENYNVTLECNISGHQVAKLNRQITRLVDIHKRPQSGDIIIAFAGVGADFTVSCDDTSSAAMPAMSTFNIYSNGTLVTEPVSDKAVNVPEPEQATEFTCEGSNYLGSTNATITFYPGSTTTPPPVTALETTTKNEKTIGSGGRTGLPTIQPSTTTNENETGDPTEPSANVAAIAGGVVAAIVIIVIIVIAVCYCKKQERFCFEAGGTPAPSNKPSGRAVGSSNGSGSEKEKLPQAAPRGHGSIQHTNDNPDQAMYAMVDKKPARGGGGGAGDAPDRGSGPGQNEPPGMLYADLDLSHKAGHTDKHVPKNENDVVVYSSILV